MSMTASATSAPETIWWLRLAETPGSAASSSGVIDTSLGIHSLNVASGRARETSGPSDDGAAGPGPAPPHPPWGWVGAPGAAGPPPPPPHRCPKTATWISLCCRPASGRQSAVWPWNPGQ